MRPTLAVRRFVHRSILIAGCSAAVAWLAAAAAADEIVAKGNTVHGTVTLLTSKDAEIETDFGKAKLTVPFTDMQSIETDAPLHILYGEDQEIRGRVLGIKDGKLLVGESLETAQAIDLSSIVQGRGAETSAIAALRSRLRYWKANADVGFGLTQATVDNTTLAAGLGAERSKSPTSLELNLGGHYGVQKRERPKPAGPQTHLADDLEGGFKGQYDLNPKYFLWISGDARYDGIQKISYRVIPAGGVGYYLYKTAATTLQVQTGGSYVYERFFGGGSNSVRGVTFGGEAQTALPYGASFHWRVDYLPAINDWTNTYLLRNDAALLFPLAGALSFKASVVDIYDSHPARNKSGQLLAKENNLVTTLGLSVSF